MNKKLFHKYSTEQVNKLGNTVIYLSTKIENLHKTKLLKLLYILDEISIKQSGVPFLNLEYKLWKLGPVANDVFINLSSENILLKDYIITNSDEGVVSILPAKKFIDDEFSDSDLKLLDYVIDKYGTLSGKELVRYTHRQNSPWYNTAQDNDLLELLENEHITNTDIIINMSMLVEHDINKLNRYNHYISEF